MKSLSIVLSSVLALALAAPQVPYNSHVVLPSSGGHQYTLTNRPQGFSIETGAALSRAAPVQHVAPVVQHVAPVVQHVAPAVQHVAVTPVAPVAPVAVRASAVQPAAAYYRQAAPAAQYAAARKSVVVAQPAPIHYSPVQYSAQFDQSAASHYVADQSAAFAAKSAAAQQYSSASAAGFRSAHQIPSANIVRQQQDISDDGSAFTYGFESDNGISVQSQGQLKVYGPEQAGHSVSGSYSYVGDDGQTYTVNYVADETGFHASGAHLPQMSEEIARSVEYNLAHPEEWTQK
uniref:Cuticular protein n=1 Tax=Nilaparvata lugens TaxID=108931 RepID=A0A2S1ZS68_NILLU|nr:cuticular protein [Nilaparvata lugens]